MDVDRWVERVCCFLLGGGSFALCASLYHLFVEWRWKRNLNKELDKIKDAILFARSETENEGKKPTLTC